MRYLFAMSDLTRPVGGRNVLLNTINVLSRAGFEAFPIYPAAEYQYNHYVCDVPAFYDTRLNLGSIPSRIKAFSKSLVSRKVNKKLRLEENDIIVVPEFWYPEVSQVFQRQRKILFAQDVFGIFRAHLRDVKSGSERIAHFSGCVATSDASEKAAERVLSAPIFRIEQNIDSSKFFYKHNKKPIICYMPRRRRAEAEIVTSIIKNKKNLKNFEIVAIENVDARALQEIMRESLIFLSFSQNEGFGLPPAEAMACGCIVIGYTGVGGAEYFTSATGFPVEDSNISEFIDTVIRVAEKYQLEPGPLDAMRKHASDYILSRYSTKKSERSVLEAWHAIDDLMRNPRVVVQSPDFRMSW